MTAAKTKQAKKPPFRVQNLRLPGQSITDRLWDIVFDRAVVPYFVALQAVLWAAFEWIAFLRPSQGSLRWPTTLLAVLAIGWAWWRGRVAIQEVKALKLGRRGEVFVAQFLDRLRPTYFIYHDVPDGDANIDHVLVGPGGVFTVETKTLSKPERGDCIVEFADGSWRANGQVLDRDPAKQARAQAASLRRHLTEWGFRDVAVQPVVVFPGWFVKPTDEPTGVWMLEPKGFVSYLRQRDARISDDSARAMAAAVAAYVRARAEVELEAASHGR